MAENNPIKVTEEEELRGKVNGLLHDIKRQESDYDELREEFNKQEEFYESVKEESNDQFDKIRELEKDLEFYKAIIKKLVSND